MFEFNHHAQKPVCLSDDRIQTPCTETCLLYRWSNSNTRCRTCLPIRWSNTNTLRRNLSVNRWSNTNTMHRRLFAYWKIEYKQHAQTSVCLIDDRIQTLRVDTCLLFRWSNSNTMCRTCLLIGRSNSNTMRRNLSAYLMIEYKHIAQNPVCFLDDRIQIPCTDACLLIRWSNTNNMRRHLST